LQRRGGKKYKTLVSLCYVRGLKVQQPTQEDALYLLAKFHTMFFFFLAYLNRHPHKVLSIVNNCTLWGQRWVQGKRKPLILPCWKAHNIAFIFIYICSSFQSKPLEHQLFGIEERRASCAQISQMGRIFFWVEFFLGASGSDSCECLFFFAHIWMS